MGYLILVRHGESRWNLENKFTGWVDVPLSEAGVQEVLLTARNLTDLQIDVGFTSCLERAQETLLLILANQKYTGFFSHENEPESAKYEFTPTNREILIHTNVALNERHYGELQGRNKAEAAKQFGLDQVLAWRRGFNATPPGGENLESVYERVVPYFKNRVIPELKLNKNVLLTAHGNSLRAIIKYLENISDDEIVHLELGMAKPIIYKFLNDKLINQTGEHSFDRPVHW